MSLASFTPATAAITHKGEVAFTVRGLTLADLSLMMRTHMPDIHLLAALWTQYQAEGLDGDIFPFLTTLATDAPFVVAHIIAHGCGEPGLHEKAALLPVPLQIEALEAVFRLTFEEYGGLEKTGAALARMVRSFSAASAPESLLQLAKGALAPGR